ncbi:hypothetical protein AGMMS49959_12210 [Planctomycetales bacterium]|nr:hypothetical protein AGMMS49959_12210 [Planctomycetales bacterium]
MGLQNTLYTGMSGLLSYQTAFNALANNTSNINAIGYKRLDTSFGDLLYNTVVPGYGEENGAGATNAAAIGNGTLVAAQTHNFTQGPLNNTGRTLDFAIDGAGFFVLNGGNAGELLTRAGNFYLGQSSATTVDLLSNDGMQVLGYNATPEGTLNNSMSAIRLPQLGTLYPGVATRTVEMNGNLLPNTPVATGNTITSADNWLKADGVTPVDYLNVGAVQTSAALRDKTTGQDATAQTLLANLQFTDSQNIVGAQNAQKNFDAVNANPDATPEQKAAAQKALDEAQKKLAASWQNLYNEPSGSTVNSREMTINFERGGVAYSKTLTVTPATTLADFSTWLCGGLGDDGSAARADGGVLGTYHTRDYTLIPDGFAAAGEQAGGFLSIDETGVHFNIASNVGAINTLGNIMLTTTANVTTADGASRNIVDDFYQFFNANEKLPADTADNPVALYEKVSPNPTAYAMQVEDQMLYLVKLSADDEGSTWRWYAAQTTNVAVENPDNGAVGQGTGLVRFDNEGNMIKETADLGATLNFDFSHVTQVGAARSLTAGADGYIQGSLMTYTNAPDGMIYGRFDNGQTSLLARLALAIVANPQGLDGKSGTTFSANEISGAAIYSGTGVWANIFGSCYGGYLEESNFELGAQSIIYQRAYQFSSKLVTTANEMLQTAYNLKS